MQMFEKLNCYIKNYLSNVEKCINLYLKYHLTLLQVSDSTA